MVDFAGEGVVGLRLLRQGRVINVACRPRGTIHARVLGQAVVIQDPLRDGVDSVRRDDVAFERLSDELPGSGSGRARQRIVNRDEVRVRGEVAVAERLGRNPRVPREVETRALIRDSLIADHVEGLVPENGAADRAAGPVRIALDLRLASSLPEEVVRAPARRFGKVVGRTAEAIGSGFDDHAGHTALGVAELGVEGRRLHLELLNQIGGRDVGRDHLVGVCRGGARQAVNQQVAAVAARAVHGVSDDVSRLERTIQPLVARVGQAGRQSHDLVGIAVDQRQRREALLVDDQPHVGVRGVQPGGLSDDADRLLEGADFQHDGQVARLADLEHDVVLDVLLETLELDGDRVGAGKQIVELKQALLIGCRRGRRASGHVRDGHGRPGNDRLAWCR